VGTLTYRKRRRLEQAAKALLNEERWQEAIAAYRQLSALDPRQPNYWWWMGCAYRGLGDLKTAEACEAKERELSREILRPMAEEMLRSRQLIERMYGPGRGTVTKKEVRATESEPPEKTRPD
jgi:tetratricopeptide (TPR) repeat protein